MKTQTHMHNWCDKHTRNCHCRWEIAGEVGEKAGKTRGKAGKRLTTTTMEAEIEVECSLIQQIWQWRWFWYFERADRSTISDSFLTWPKRLDIAAQGLSSAQKCTEKKVIIIMGFLIKNISYKYYMPSLSLSLLKFLNGFANFVISRPIWS